MESFDYVIVGAGTAGCVLAERLSASGRHRVLVLEAGGSDARFWIKAPIGYGFTFADPSVNWKYQTAPSPGLDGRSMYWPRGRVVGGSSSINALVYCRGMPADFDDWRALGNPGWGWKDVRPCFERSERRVTPDGRASTDGPLDVKDVTPYLHPMREQWLAAAAELGLPVTDDFNGSSPEGFGCYQVYDPGRPPLVGGGRFPAPRPAPRRREVGDRAWVAKLRCEGRRVIGVDYVRGGASCYARADREVIVCGGAVNSPQLLQLSGIGPARHAVSARHRARARQPGGRRQSAGPSGRGVLVQGDSPHLERGASFSDPPGDRGREISHRAARPVEPQRQSVRRIRSRASRRRSPRRTAVLQPGHLRSGRRDAQAHQGRCLPRILFVLSAHAAHQHGPHRSSTARTSASRRALPRTICPRTRTCKMCSTAVG